VSDRKVPLIFGEGYFKLPVRSYSGYRQRHYEEPELAMVGMKCHKAAIFSAEEDP
jgi:hypothetical protein